MGDVIHGKTLVVDGESTVESFRLEYFGNPPAGGASNTQGAVERIDGNTDWRGEYQLRGYQPVRFPNDSFTFQGTGASGAGAGSKAVSGTARVSELEIELDIANGEFIRSRVRFGANGALSLAQDATTLADSTTPGSVSAKGMYLKLNNVTQTHVDYMRLIFRAPNQVAYCDSSTNGQIYRTEGDLDAELLWRVNSDDPADFPTKGQLYETLVYVTSTTYWDIDYMRITGIRPWEVDRTQNRRPMNFAVHAQFTGFSTSAGHIINPGLTQKWPPA